MRIKTKVRLFLRRLRKRIRENRVVVWMFKPRGPWRAILLWHRKRQINRSLRILDALDWRMRQIGWTRQQRRQFWRDFIKKQEFRTGTFNQLTQQ